MKVQELINKLSKYAPDTTVYVEDHYVSCYETDEGMMYEQDEVPFIEERLDGSVIIKAKD